MTAAERPERIVVGVDADVREGDGRASAVAVDWVTERVRSGQHDITLITVTDGMGDDQNSIDARFASFQRQLIDTGHGTVVRTDTRFGEPVSTLTTAAGSADLLVIGSRRSRPLRTALDGWLPDRIPTTAQTPTVVVPDDWTTSTGDIVVGVDDETGGAALVFAAAEALRTRRGLSLVRMWRRPAPRVGGMVRARMDATQEEARNRRVLEDARRTVRSEHPQLTPKTLLIEGAPDGLLAELSVPASLTVIGRQHHSTLGGALGGSVAHALIRFSRTPVCVVPPTSPSGSLRFAATSAIPETTHP